MPVVTNVWDLCECCGEGEGCGPICSGDPPDSIFVTFVLSGDPCHCFQDFTYELFYQVAASSANQLVFSNYAAGLGGGCLKCEEDDDGLFRDQCMQLVITCADPDTLNYDFSVDMPRDLPFTRWLLEASKTISSAGLPVDCLGGGLDTTINSGITLVETISPGEPVPVDCIPTELIFTT